MGVAITSMASGLITDGSFYTIISLAEINQFLALFALLSINFYPKILNDLYNAQMMWSFNIISIPSFLDIECKNIQNDDQLPFNYNYHPSLSSSNYICNLMPLMISSSGFFALYLILHVVKILLKVRKSFEWNGFINLLNSSVIIIIVITFVSFTFVF